MQITTALLIGSLIAVPAAASAATPGAAQKASVAKHASPAAATHATRGVVKSVDASTLVITRKGHGQSEMTFTINGSTTREGTMAVGTPVSVRYRADGQTLVATAIRGPQPKQAAHTAQKKK